MKNHTLAIKRLSKEYQSLIAKPVKNILAIPNPNNIFEWHFILYDLDYPYTDGYFHGKLLFPSDYPTKPPNLIFITPNGRFQPQEKICLSFTSYHPESWSIAWNVENMLIGLISFMHTAERTTGSVITSANEKMRLAKQSLNFNFRNKEFVKIFQGHYKKLNINFEENGESLMKESEIERNDGEFHKKCLFWIIAFVLILITYFYLKGKF